jgi:hypothetical protein
MRREKRVELTLFTLFLDLAVNQSYAIFKTLAKGKDAKIGLSDFKRVLCHQLIQKQMEKRKKKVIFKP